MRALRPRLLFVGTLLTEPGRPAQIYRCDPDRDEPVENGPLVRRRDRPTVHWQGVDPHQPPPTTHADTHTPHKRVGWGIQATLHAHTPRRQAHARPGSARVHMERMISRTVLVFGCMCAACLCVCKQVKACMHACMHAWAHVAGSRRRATACVRPGERGVLPHDRMPRRPPAAAHGHSLNPGSFGEKAFVERTFPRRCLHLPTTVLQYLRAKLPRRSVRQSSAYRE